MRDPLTGVRRTLNNGDRRVCGVAQGTKVSCEEGQAADSHQDHQGAAGLIRGQRGKGATAVTPRRNEDLVRDAPVCERNAS